MKNEEIKKEVKMKKAPSEMMLTSRGYLVQSGGILGTLFGVFLSTVGVYEAVGGTSLTINLLSLFAVTVDQVLGLVFLIVGIAALVGGIVLSYFGFKLQRLNVACIILGSCSLIIPSLILRMGYNLAAGIVAVVLGYLWLATLFLWLKG